MEIRNIAIIAHVDHGKTTLTDQMLLQTGMTTGDATMDTDAIETERGITIYAKNTSILYTDPKTGVESKINIVDTPGHADFGSEVERVLRSIDSVLLIVDAQEGPMPQTRFVLKKSLELGHHPIVVLNKIDKPAANPVEAHDAVFELFMELGASETQLEFATVYAIGRDGRAGLTAEGIADDLVPLFESIIEHVPVAKKEDAAPLSAQAFNLAYDDYLGRLAAARVYEGTLKVGPVMIKDATGAIRTGKIAKLFTFKGTARNEVTQVEAGDMALIAGIEDVNIGDTFVDDESTEAMPAITIDEPTIMLDFLINNSPFAGREGKYVTTRQIRERLERELQTNVGLQVDFGDGASALEGFKVYGRGEMHIAVLLENMRREGHEVQIGEPQVIIKDIDGVKSEPFEEVTIDVPMEFQGAVIEKLGKRGVHMTNMRHHESQVTITLEGPTRGLFGYRGEFVIDTRGEGILSARVIGFRPHAGPITKRHVGSMVSMISGKTSGFALANLQGRGQLYLGAGAQVYEGMVIGNTSKGSELIVNPVKGKQLTNMRASGTDENISLTPPLTMTVEKGIEIIQGDEYLEVTPHSVRLRKKILQESIRARANKKSK
ncbi:MAG: GTP-binding protein [Planctomycetota bacterium]|jgi:GTP-binding protein